jgi:type II secretory pathway pseudopilin PulG
MTDQIMNSSRPDISLRLRPVRAGTGFTLMELLLVIAVILTLMGFLLPVIRSAWMRSEDHTARAQMQIFSIGVNQYVQEFDELPEFDPPDGYDAPGSTPRAGAELLFHYLCEKQKRGEHVFVCAIPPQHSVDQGPGKKPALVSPLHGYYTFAIEGDAATHRRAQLVLIDPGRDRLLGGTVDPGKGFVADGSDANGDGTSDAADNLIERISAR